VKTNIQDNVVYVGPKSAIYKGELSCKNLVWLNDSYAHLDKFNARAQIRAHGKSIPVEVSISEEVLIKAVDSTFEAVAAGQSVVLYDFDTDFKVIAQATIN
jgi:tRNA U34 2-thiouridine synthase MnmA/TrmU